MKNLFRKWVLAHGQWLAGAIAITAATLHAATPPQVQTLGGGPNQLSPARSGNANGDTFNVAKFNNPYAVAIDTNGNLLIADRANNKVRKVARPGEGDSITSTFASRLPAPVGIDVDRSNYVFVVTYGDGRMRVFNGSGSLLRTVSGLVRPTALVLDTNGNAYVTELGGDVKRIAPDGSIETIATGFVKPQGIAILLNGLLAVSESGTHTIYTVNPVTGATAIYAGGNGAGFNDGPGEGSQFNKPYKLATAPNGALVVADRANHRVRVIATNRVVSTLYGVPKNQWSRVFPGWVDGDGGDNGVAAAHDPIGVVVSHDGTVYVTEIYWDLLRQVTETGLANTNIVINTNGNGTNITILLPAPLFSPTYGYFPFGVTVTVTSAAPVYYTTDGSEPTTNSLSVPLTNGIGTFVFAESRRDLRSLRLKALIPDGYSPTVGGLETPRNEVLVPRDFIAGSRANILVPVVCNLRSGARVQSFQYRVEITPENGGPPVLPYFDAVSILTNDFVQLVTPAKDIKGASFTVLPYVYTNTGVTTRGLVVTASGPEANVDFTDFSTTALLRVPIDPSAVSGHTYRVDVLYPSATSDGYQADLPLTNGPSRRITIGSIPWLVGDTAPGVGYNAGEFGNRDLVNSDANSVLFATVGLRAPFEFSDAFNAMDAYPPEPAGLPDGNGILEYLDWQVVLERSLRLDPNNFLRFWVDGGIIDYVPTSLSYDGRNKASGGAKSGEAPVAPGDVWTRGATLSADNLYNRPQGLVDVPIRIKVATNTTVAGLCFRVLVEAEDGAPAPADVTVEALMGGSAFQALPGAANNDLVCSWTMVPSPALHLNGAATIARLRFRIPAGAAAGHHYTVRIVRPSGAEDKQTPVLFDSIPGSVWVLWTPDASAARLTSDEWRVNFFGPTNSPAAADDADPDGDGASNAQEYTDGTNPVDALSVLQLWQNTEGDVLRLSWLSAPNKVYVIDGANSAGGPWTAVISGVVGDGYVQQVNAPPPRAPFYRIRVQP